MYSYAAKVLRVVDGDTLDLEIDLGFHTSVRERFRLYGVNAPELHSKDLEEKKRGEAARDFLVKLLEPEKTILVDVHRGQEKFGRWLAEITLNRYVGDVPVSLTKALIDAGHAKPYFGEKR